MNFKHRTVRINLPRCYPLVVEFNWAHWSPMGTNHGPKSMPSVIAVTAVKLNVNPMNWGRRLWLYVRGGYACHADFFLDRRPLAC